MKSLYKIVVAVMLIAMVLSACGSKAEPTEAAAVDPLGMSWDEIVAQAKDEGELVFYAWWGEEFWKTAAQNFEDEYGIKVNVVMADNTVDKLLSEAGNEVGTVDVQLFGGAGVKTMIDGGYLYGPILDKIPNSDKLDPILSSYQEGTPTGGYLVPVYRNQVGLLYNPEKVTDPPQTWEELQAFIDENPQQFGFCDPDKGGSGQAMVQTVVANLTGGLDQYLEDTEVDPAKVEKWTVVWDWFNENLPKVTYTSSNNESIDTLNQGQTSLVLAWDDDTLIAYNKGTLFKGAKMYLPEFGLPGGGDSLGIIKNAPHKAAGMLWISFLISDKEQVLLNSIIGSYPARVDLTGFTALLSDADRLANGTPWYPAPYKKYAHDEFVKNVLMK